MSDSEGIEGYFWDWVTDAYPLSYGRLYNQLRFGGVAHVDAVNQAETAARYALNAASQRAAFRDYFPDFRALSVWMVFVGRHQVEDSLNSRLGQGNEALSAPEGNTHGLSTAWAYFSELEPGTKRILFWYYLDGLADSEIGVLLELNESEVAAARARGLERVRRRFHSEGAGE
jgi:hypothetical protein